MNVRNFLRKAVQQEFVLIYHWLICHIFLITQEFLSLFSFSVDRILYHFIFHFAQLVTTFFSRKFFSANETTYKLQI